MLLRDVNSPAKTPVIDEFAYAPSWYANNTNFVFSASERGGSRIVRAAITGGGKTYVSRNPLGKGDSRPVVKGDVILCDTEINGRRQIMSMKDNGTEVTVLGEGHSPFWHPFSNKFLFIRNGNVFEMDLGNVQVTQLYSDPNFECAMPSYSANGQYIIFQKGAVIKSGARPPQGARRWQIFIIKPDGTGLSALTVPEVDAWSPSWDRNNNIYFISDAAGSTEIYKARINFR